MNNIEILEELKARVKLYKKSTDVQFTFTKSDIEAIENLIQEYKELKKKIKKIEDTVRNGMKNLWIDSCAEDSGKYSAYISILNILEEGE